MQRTRSGRVPAVFGALAAILLSLLSCGQRPPQVSSIRWNDRSGAALVFRDAARRPSGEEGRLSAAAPRDRLQLDRPHAVGADEALELDLSRLAAGKPLRLRILLAGGRGSDALRQSEDLTLRDDRTFYVMPLPVGRLLASVELELVETEGGELQRRSAAPAPSPAVALAALSFRPMFRGFERLPSAVRLSSGFSLYVQDGRQHAEITEPFAGMEGSAQRGDGAPTLIVDYGRCIGGSLFELGPGATRGERLHLRSDPSGLRTALGAALFAARAPKIDMVLPLGVDLRSFYVASMAGGDAELADLGRVLLSPPAAQATDFDLYRWDRFPDVLVLDFKDYATQDRYLKRIAFFVEKVGYRGSLVPDAEIEALHGWNAHDYRPEDLAAFFQRAAAKDFPLDAEERSLRTLLESHGILVEAGGRIAAGRGAFISIARESPPYLRMQFIVHESTHAIFFVDADYRAFVRSLWASIGDDERWFWKLYFNWAGYDTSSEYLMANEFQAYLLQQPTSRAEEYFTKTQSAQILKKHPEYKPAVDAYMQKFGKRYAERASTIEAWIKAKYGLEAGRTYSLY